MPGTTRKKTKTSKKPGPKPGRKVTRKKTKKKAVKKKAARKTAQKKPVKKKKAARKTARRQVTKLIIDKNNDYLDGQAEHMREKRAAARVLEIPDPADIKRRNRCLKNPVLFCRTYFPEIFFNPFSENQKVQIRAIDDRIKFGGYQALAAMRGDGKTSITEIIGGIYAILKGSVHYLVLLGANATFGGDLLKDIKLHFEFNDLLAADFPEMCLPIRALEGSPQRAARLTTRPAGTDNKPERTRMIWAANEVVFPTVQLKNGKLAPGSGAIITTRGIDAAIRGLVRQGKRPDLIIGDDLETRESVKSLDQTAYRIKTLQDDVLGLEGPNKRMPVVLLGTIMAAGCLIDQFTDRKLKPAWQGIRQKRLIKYPANMDLWDKYIELRQRDQADKDDSTGRTAFEFYKENKKAMDAGAVVANPYRYRIAAAPDGSPMELTALQACFNDIADKGQGSFNSEYQNEPQTDDSTETTQLTAEIIQKRCNGFAKGVIPADTEYITVGIDIGGRLIYWSAIAWKAGGIGHIFDYGTEPVNSPVMGKLTDKRNLQALDAAIYTTLLTWRDIYGNGWIVENTDKTRAADLVCIDAGYRDKAVYRFIKSIPGNQFIAVKGFGSSQRAAYPNPRGKRKIIGVNWWGSFQIDDKIWLYNVNSDVWKLHVHTGFMVSADTAGALTLFGNDPYMHRTFAKQITAEVWTEEFKPGKGIKRYFYIIYKQNHYLDTAHYASAAKSILKKLIEIAAKNKKKARKTSKSGGGYLSDIPEL